MRLIDANTVYKILNDIGGCDAADEWSKGFDAAIDEAIMQISNAPTIEAEPVRYAKWEPLPPRLEPGILCRNIGETDFKPFFSSGIGDRCSECHYHDEFAIFNTKYCPSCGAKMV